MLNVKSKTFSQKIEKRQEFLTKVARKIELCSIFLQPSVAF